MLHEFCMGTGLAKAQVLHEDTLFRRFLQIQLHPWVAQQVMHLLVVNLEEGAAKQELLVGSLADGLQDVSETTGDNALQLGIARLTHHRVRLAASCLPVGEDCAVIPFQYVCDQCEGGLAVYQCLLGPLCEDCIVCKALEVVGLVRFGEVDLAIVLIDSHDGGAAPLLLRLAEGAHPYDHTNALTHRREQSKIIIWEQ